MSEQDGAKPSGAAKRKSKAGRTAAPSPSPVPPTTAGRDDDSAATGGPTTTRPRRGRAFGVLVLLAVMFAAGLAAGVVYAPQLADLLPLEQAPGATSDPPSGLAAFEDRLRALEAESRQDPALGGVAAEVDQVTAGLTQLGARLTEAETRLGALGRLTERIDALETALAGLSAGPSGAGAANLTAVLEHLAALEARAVSAGDAIDGGATVSARDQLDLFSAAIATVEERLVALESEADPERLRRLAFALSVAELRKAVRGADPYGADLEAVRKLSPDTAGHVAPAVAAALDALALRAVSGVPAMAGLRQRFAALAPEIVRHAGRKEEAGWFDQTLERLSSVVTVRRTGEVTGDTVDARVARAEQRLDAGQLAPAVAEVAALSGAPARIAAPWLKDAEARLAAAHALDDLSGHALSALGSPASTE